MKTQQRIVFLVIAVVIIGIIYFASLQYGAPKDGGVATSTPIAELETYKNQSFEFQYPSNWRAFEQLQGRVTLLKSETFPDIASEIYALGEQIHVSEAVLDGPDKKFTPKEYVDIISTEENLYEGNPTLVRKEKINGVDAVRIEHVNADYQPTVAYYFITGEKLFIVYMYPYDMASSGGVKNHEDFMRVVGSLKFTE